MGRLNHQVLVKSISEDTGITESDVANVIKSFIKIATAAIVRGDEIVIKNFAKFSLKSIAAKRIWYAKEEKFIKVPDRYKPKTIFSQSLLNAVRGKK